MSLSSSDKDEVRSIAKGVASAVATDVAKDIAKDTVNETIEKGFTNVVLELEKLIDNVARGFERKNSKLEIQLTSLETSNINNASNIEKLTILVTALSESCNKNSEAVTKVVTKWEEKEEFSRRSWAKAGIIATILGVAIGAYSVYPRKEKPIIPAKIEAVKEDPSDKDRPKH